MRVIENEPIPADFAGLFGEWLYNLRASLDYIIWAAASYASGTLPPPNEGVLEYPVYDNEAAGRRIFIASKDCQNTNSSGSG